MSALNHGCAGPPIEDEEGWYTAACECGFEIDGLPDLETAVDILMEHAFEAGVHWHTQNEGGSA